MADQAKHMARTAEIHSKVTRTWRLSPRISPPWRAAA